MGGEGVGGHVPGAARPAAQAAPATPTPPQPQPWPHPHPCTPRPGLQEVVLDDVPDDAVRVKVAPPPFGAKVFGKDDLHVANVLAGPQGLKHQVGKAQDGQVLDELLAQVVVDAKHLGLGEVLGQGGGQLGVTGRIPPKRFLHDDPGPAGGGGGGRRRGRRRGDKDGRRDRKVKHAVGARVAGLRLRAPLAQGPKILRRPVLPCLVKAAGQERVRCIAAPRAGRQATGQGRTDVRPKLLVRHRRPGIAKHGEMRGQVAVVKERKQGGVDLFAREVARRTHDDDGQRRRRPVLCL